MREKSSFTQHLSDEEGLEIIVRVLWYVRGQPNSSVLPSWIVFGTCAECQTQAGEGSDICHTFLLGLNSRCWSWWLNLRKTHLQTIMFLVYLGLLWLSYQSVPGQRLTWAKKRCHSIFNICLSSVINCTFTLVFLELVQQLGQYLSAQF